MKVAKIIYITKVSLKLLRSKMARDEARHGKAFEGLLNRYFK